MSFVFLECDWFRKHLNSAPLVCCENCHEKLGNKRIFVSPFKEDGINTDWQLCVQGIVCCRMYDFVRGLDRNFWVAQAELYGTKRDDGRGYIYPSSPERNTERASSGSQVQQTSRATSSARRGVAKPRRVDAAALREEDERGGIRGWKR